MNDLLQSDALGEKTIKVGGRTVTLHQEWQKLEPVWRKLENEGHCTVFQTFDWVASWYSTTLRFRKAQPLVVTVADNRGIVWLFPMCRHRRKGLDFISFADLGVSDYAGPIMAQDDGISPDEIPEVLRAVVKILSGCDILHFQKLQQSIEGKPNPLLRIGHVVAMRESCYGIEVRKPWSELSKTVMQSRLRSTVRQQRKKIAGIGPLRLEHYSDPQTLTKAMDVLWDMRRGRFHRIGRKETSEVWRSFYYDVVGNPERKLDVCITILRVGDTPIAACFGLTRGKAYHVVMPTFAVEEWETYRPGMLMFDAMLEEFGPKTGFDGYFDFTIGDEPYKQRFGAKGSPLMECMTPRSLKGALAYIYWRVKASRRHKNRSNAVQPDPV